MSASVETQESMWRHVELTAQFSSTGTTKTQLLQRTGFDMTKILGDSLPLALEPGEKAIEAMVFHQLRPIERQLGNVMDAMA